MGIIQIVDQKTFALLVAGFAAVLLVMWWRWPKITRRRNPLEDMMNSLMPPS